MLESFLLSMFPKALSWLLRRRLAEFERLYDCDMSYSRAMLEANPLSVLTVHRAGGLSRYRGPLSASAHHAVRIVADLHEDCGPCLQLAVTMALQAGVPKRTVVALICGDRTGEKDVDLVTDFARAVLAQEDAQAELRERVLARYGQDGLTAVAFALTGARMYPMLKAVLGYAQCYPAVSVGEQLVRLPAAKPPIAEAMGN